MKKKVFVSGCFDMLHPGHIRFLEEAATHGELHIGIGSDANVMALKGRKTVFTQAERQYMLQALKCVTSCRVNKGKGKLDFLAELDELKPDIFFVNDDGGGSDEKSRLCEKLGIQYIVSKRIPQEGMKTHSTTALRAEHGIA